jgi:hypothetical protein
MQTIPARPDVTPPAKKKRHTGLIILAVLGGLLVLGALSGATETTVDTPTDVTADTGAGFEVTAELVVDTMADSQIQTFCTAYYQLGDYDLALAQFTDGYGMSQDPSAEDVFDELLLRC